MKLRRLNAHDVVFIVAAMVVIVVVVFATLLLHSHRDVAMFFATSWTSTLSSQWRMHSGSMLSAAVNPLHH